MHGLYQFSSSLILTNTKHSKWMKSAELMVSLYFLFATCSFVKHEPFWGKTS